MKVSLGKKSRWQRTIGPIASFVKGKTLVVNGRALSVEKAAKPAARAIGGLVLATAASAAVSSLRGKKVS